MHSVIVFLALVACANADLIPQADTTELVPKDVTIDAAFRYGTDIIFIAGDEYLAVGPDGKQKYIKERTGTSGVPRATEIKAAIHWPAHTVTTNYGKERSFDVNEATSTATKNPYTQDNFLKGGPPDAVAYLKDYFLVIKGCDYVASLTPLPNNQPPLHVTDLGLPCNFDAAWSSLDRTVVTLLKGDQIWTWNIFYNILGPIPFSTVYNIHSWQLIPNPDLRYKL